MVNFDLSPLNSHNNYYYKTENKVKGVLYRPRSHNYEMTFKQNDIIVDTVVHASIHPAKKHVQVGTYVSRIKLLYSNSLSDNNNNNIIIIAMFCGQDIKLL